MPQPLIVGAGPAGLAAALFLSLQGNAPRIIDSAASISSTSRALAVNPRTLQIFEQTGITKEMLAVGKRLLGATLWHGAKPIAQISFSELHHEYPFMLALSLASTSRFLEEKLNQQNVYVERSVTLNACKNSPEGVIATLTLPDGNAQNVECPWMLAADGSRSVARKGLDISFNGTSFEKEWHLVDVPLSTSLPEDCAHIQFISGGFLFVARVVDNSAKTQHGDPLWRIMGNVPNLLERFERGKATGPAVWSSSFHISHRINARLQDGNIYFAGDAAHVHSPVGARGMNLGIEDAWTFCTLLKQGKLSSYSDLRHAIDADVVRKVERLSRIMRCISLRATACNPCIGEITLDA